MGFWGFFFFWSLLLFPWCNETPSIKYFQGLRISFISFRNVNPEEFFVSIKEQNFRKVCKGHLGNMDLNRINLSHPIPLRWLCVQFHNTPQAEKARVKLIDKTIQLKIFKVRGDINKMC